MTNCPFIAPFTGCQERGIHYKDMRDWCSGSDIISHKPKFKFEIAVKVPVPVRGMLRSFLGIALFGLAVLTYFVPSLILSHWTNSRPKHQYAQASVLVSYAYFEKDQEQRANFEYFLAAGAVPSPTQQDIAFVFVIATDKCSPCKGLLPQST